MERQRPTPKLEGWKPLQEFGWASPAGGRARFPALQRSTSTPTMRTEAERSGWIPLQVSWLNPRETRPLQRAADAAAPSPRQFSPVTKRLSAAGAGPKGPRTVKEEALGESTDLEKVMRWRMLMYQGMPSAHIKVMVDQESIFGQTSTAEGRPRLHEPDLVSPAAYLRPRPGGPQDAAPESPGGAATHMMSGRSSPSGARRPWTLSDAVPMREDPEAPDNVWQPLMAGVRPWAADRDQGMQRMLASGKHLRRNVDVSAYNGAQIVNGEKNVFYMTLNEPSRPIRGFPG